MRTIDAKSYLTALCELTEKGETVSTVVSGGSMIPFLAGNRDFVCLEKPRRELRVGDIVLFRRLNGDFILHRIRYIRDDGYYLIGDRQTVTEGPVNSEQILALVTRVRRKDRWLTPKSIRWNFYSRVWLRMIPLRPAVFRIRDALSGNKKA